MYRGIGDNAFTSDYHTNMAKTLLLRDFADKYYKEPIYGMIAAFVVATSVFVVSLVRIKSERTNKEQETRKERR